MSEKKMSDRISEILTHADFTMTGFCFEESKKKLYMGIQRRNRSGEITPASSIIRKIQDVAGEETQLFINGKLEVPIPLS